MPEIEFEQHDLGPGDYSELVALWRQAGLSIRPEGRDAQTAFMEQMADGRQRVVGLRRASGELVAVIVLTHDSRKGWINRLAVDPAYRRRGLAQRLIAEAERYFTQDLGLEVWAALIEGENKVSQSLFDRAGYYKHDVVYVSKRLRSDA